jgi:hypothetical protein
MSKLNIKSNTINNYDKDHFEYIQHKTKQYKQIIEIHKELYIVNIEKKLKNKDFKVESKTEEEIENEYDEIVYHYRCTGRNKDEQKIMKMFRFIPNSENY